MIDLTDKKFLNKLSKDLNNGKAYIEDDSLFEIYKPFSSKMFIIFDNHNNKAVYRNSNLELCIKEFNMKKYGILPSGKKNLKPKK